MFSKPSDPDEALAPVLAAIEPGERVGAGLEADRLVVHVERAHQLGVVQVIVGVPLNGGVRYVSSSSATTTAGDEELSWRSPNNRHRKAVATSSDRPRVN